MTELEKALHNVLNAMSAARRVMLDDYAGNAEIVGALAREELAIGKLLRMVEERKEGKE